MTPPPPSGVFQKNIHFWADGRPLRGREVLSEDLPANVANNIVLSKTVEDSRAKHPHSKYNFESLLTITLEVC